MGWAGGGPGPDFFIYLGTGPASWLGNPHDGTIWAEVADEASMAVAANVSLLPVPPTKPGQMHLLAKHVPVRAAPWLPPEGALDASASVGREGGSGGGGTAGGDGGGALSAAEPLGVLKVAGTAVDETSSRCSPSCHALPHTELHGRVVLWGETHLVDDAAACCEACHRHAASLKARSKDGSADTKSCNTWVFCASESRCAKRYRQCWLKHSDDLWADSTLLVGTSDAWISGTNEAAPREHPSGAGRVSPPAAEADIALTVDVSLPRVAVPPTTLRVKLRAVGAPRATALVRSIAEAHEKATRAATSGGSSRLLTDAASANSDTLAAATCAHGPARLLDAHIVPTRFGSANVTDGLGPHSRWPRGKAMIRGTLGGPPAALSARLLRPAGGSVAANGSSSAEGPSQPSAVEPHPVGVRRGSLAWGVSGGDGPIFMVAIADMPHLGVSHTVWGEIVAEDLPALDALAGEVASGRLHLPAALSLARIPRQP